MQIVGDEGLEPTPKSPEKTAISAQGGANSDARPDAAAHLDAELARIVTAWPGLPASTRRRIVTLVDETSNG
jgi:hypothetical protein